MTEPINFDECQVRDWRDLILRLQSLTRNDQGASVIDVRVLCVRGQPAYWFAPRKRTVEPASGARVFCGALDPPDA